MLLPVVVLLVMQCACYIEDPYEDGWSCWEEGPMTVKYTDSGNPVEGLRTFYTHGGQWDSWHVSNLAAQVILKEKMGITLLSCIGDHPEDGLPCYDTTKFPHGLYSEIENNRIDVMLEVWGGHVVQANLEEKIFAEEITSLGQTGVMGVEVFITADYDGTWKLGSFAGLKDPAIQSALLTESGALFNEFKDKLAGGVFMKYSQPWTRPALVHHDAPDFTATAATMPTKPIVFSVGWGWTCTKWTFDMMHDHGLDTIYDIWFFKSEALSIEMMTYAKANNLHYVTYMWEPSFAFGGYQKQLVTGKYPQVEGCRQRSECDAPAAPLQKIGSSALRDDIPEVNTMLRRYSFRDNIDLNKIIYDKVANEISWKQAVCNFLQANEPVWGKTVIDIERIEFTDPWWKVWVQIGGVLMGGLFVGALVWQLWKTLKPGDAAYEKLTLKDKWRKEAKMEIATQVMYVSFETMDVGSTCYATYTCFTIAGDNYVMIVGFVVVLILEVLSAIFIVHQRFRLLKPAFAKIKGTWKPENDMMMSQKITALMWKNAVHDRYTAELLQFLAGISEDGGAILLYTFVFIEGYMETSFVIGSIMSCIGFGYKMASLEKMQIWKAKHPFNIDPIEEDEVPQLDGMVKLSPEDDEASKSKDD